MQKHHYETLGITPKITLEGLKKTYKGLARRYHPDMNKNPKALEIFNQITEAYNALLPIYERLENIRSRPSEKPFIDPRIVKEVRWPNAASKKTITTTEPEEDLESKTEADITPIRPIDSRVIYYGRQTKGTLIDIVA